MKHLLVAVVMALLINIYASHSFREAMQDSQLCTIVDATTSTERKYVVLTVANERYLDVLLHWVAHFHHICKSLSHLQVLCTDAYCHDQLAARNIPSRIAPTNRALATVNDLWLYRTEITYQYLSMGYDVIQTDVDALWLGNPFPWFQENNASVVASRGSFPDNVASKLGATVCMGLIYIRSTDISVALFKRLRAVMASTAHPDDQVIFNALLLSWVQPPASRFAYTESDQVDFLAVKGATSDEQNAIAFLPHSRFPRICDHLNNLTSVVVLHCLSQKSGTSKIEMLKQMELWKLRPDWYDILPSEHESVSSYLNRLTIENIDQTNIDG